MFNLTIQLHYTIANLPEPWDQFFWWRILNITCGMDHIFWNQPLLIHSTKTSTHHYATLFFFLSVSLAMNLIVSQNSAMSVKGYAMYQVHINHYQFWRPTINVKSSTSEEIALSCCMLIGPFLRLYSLTMNISTSFIRFFHTC